MQRLIRFLRTVKDDESGVATVELALFSTIMILVTIPAFDLARAIHDNMRLTAAMRAAMYYAYKAPNDATGIEEVLRAATPLNNAQMTFSSAQFCECGGVVIECSASCDAGKETFTRVTANYEVPLSLEYPELGNAYVFSKTSTLRTQ